MAYTCLNPPFTMPEILSIFFLSIDKYSNQVEIIFRLFEKSLFAFRLNPGFFTEEKLLKPLKALGELRKLSALWERMLKIIFYVDSRRLNEVDYF
jgi:hypothetical protein